MCLSLNTDLSRTHQARTLAVGVGRGAVAGLFKSLRTGLLIDVLRQIHRHVYITFLTRT